MYFYHSDPQKQLSIVKKQCELYGASGNVDNCVKKGRILLGKNEIDSIKFAVKVLCPLHESLGESAVEMVIYLQPISPTVVLIINMKFAHS